MCYVGVVMVLLCGCGDGMCYGCGDGIAMGVVMACAMGVVMVLLWVW